VRRLGLEKPVIVGHSIGGGVAMSYGMQFPEELTGVVFPGGLAFTEIPSGFLKFIGPATPLLGTLLSCTIYPQLQPRMVASMHRSSSTRRPCPSMFGTRCRSSCCTGRRPSR
jgi:pimeloyl-ACP methyl ester carboxylesterase